MHTKTMFYALFLLSLMLVPGVLQPIEAQSREIEALDLPAVADVVVDCGQVECPQVIIEGDPLDDGCLEIDGLPQSNPCIVRGQFDPSLWQDRETGTLWMSYTRSVPFFPFPGDYAVISQLFETRLARSDDAGQTWTTVTTINAGVEPLHEHPEAGPSVIAHEVSDLAQNPDGSWSMLWVRFNFPVAGEFGYGNALIARRDAPSPPQLAQGAAQNYLRGSLDWGEDFPTLHDAGQVGGLRDCTVVTEPAIASDGERVFIVAQCISIAVFRPGRPTVYENGAIELFEQVHGELLYIGRLLDYADAQALTAGEGGQLILTQPDLVRSRDGDWLLIVTPGNDRQDAPYQGCVVLTVDDLDSATMRRDDEGTLDIRGYITAPSDHLGPGQCAYDPASETGVLLYRGDDQPGGGLRLEIVATGLHP